MERLTEKGEDGKYFVRISRDGDLILGEEERLSPGQEKWTGWWEHTVLGNIVDRLAAYEDTGFTPEEVRQMRWIPVEERLPEKGDWVLAAYRGKGGKPLVEIAIYNPKTKVHKRGGEVYVVLEGWYRNRDWSVCDMILDQVTHWMPLPKLPKEEPNGKK